MPVFRYAALEGASGREVKGELEALDAATAAADLRRRALFPMEIAVAAAPPTAPPVARTSPLDAVRITTARDVIFFFRLLALMLRSGLTILRALEVAREQTAKPALARAIGRMRDAIASGRSVSDAFRAERRHVPEFAARLVASAEQAGELDATLERIADDLEQRHELTRSLLSALAYPAITALATGGVFVFLVTQVIPKFARFLERRGGRLPWATRFLVDLNAFLVENGLLCAFAAVVAVAALVVLRTRPAGRVATDRVLLAIPVIGGLVRAGATAQLGRTLSMLLRSGVPLVEALRVLSGTLLNAAVAQRVDLAAEGVLRGGDLASGLRDATIPPLVPQLVATGEETGSLEQVLEEVARFFEADVRRRVKQLTAAFEPFFIVVIGGLVGFVYFAFFQALYQLSAGRAS